jgi:hypothetical protein
MNIRFRNDVKKWLTEVGVIYALVAIFVGLFFLFVYFRALLSCNPTFGNKPALVEPPRYGRSP